MVVSTRAGRGRSRDDSTISTKCGARNGAVSAVSVKRSCCASRAPAGGQQPCGLHPVDDDALALQGRIEPAIGIERGGPLCEAREQRSLCRSQHRRITAEVGATGSSRAHDLVAVGGQIQIHRQDLALGEAVFQPQRENRLGDLVGHSLGRRPGERRASSSFATCCVIVDPPSTIRSSRRFRPAARAMANTSTPGCDQNRRSSAATSRRSEPAAAHRLSS